MKKITLTLTVLMAFAIFVNAQTTTTPTATTPLVSKKGYAILPQAGDYAIGIDAVPMLQYVGNVFNGTANNTAAFKFKEGQSIYLKSFIDDKTAYRAKIRIGWDTKKNKELILKNGATEADQTVEDMQKIAVKNILIGFGKEYRRGYGRLQGFYGFEGALSYGANKTIYEYGNDYTSIYPAPASTNFGTNKIGTSRVLTEKAGSVLGIGLRGFVGVEYFVAPKISLGGEFGWGLLYQRTGTGEKEVESMNFGSGQSETTTTEVAGGSSLVIDTDNMTGCIYLLFHF